MYREIKDYAIIGNLRSAALVSCGGSIDWAPAPFIDSASVFAGILDDSRGGRWRIEPKDQNFKSKQKYVHQTNILETEFSTEGGVMKLIDFIPVEKGNDVIIPEDKAIFEIYRKVVCVSGMCNILVDFAPRFDYARASTEVLPSGNTIFVQGGGIDGVLISGIPLSCQDVDIAIGETTLAPGEYVIFVFRFNTKEVIDNLELSFELEYEYTKNFWTNWVTHCDFGRCSFTPFWQTQVERSALLLKILFFEPTGAIAAAPTTSLPESIGGVRNWDYRYSWIRDSAFTLSALLDIGHVQEAEKYLNWLLRVCNDGVSISKHPEELQIVYGLHGERELREEHLAHLSGYKNSKPVRIGNNAYQQRQWDIYGSILDTVWQMCEVHKESTVARDNWNNLCAIAEYVIKIWTEPDEGLWEVRGGAQHFTYSKVMCWVALDRATLLARRYSLPAPLARWQKVKDEIHSAVLEHAWSSEKRSFTQSFDTDAPDASLLRLPAVGFISGKDPKMLSTIERIEKDLSCGHGLFYRYKMEDGLPGQEGAFFLASFWFVDALILAGDVARAATMFSRILEYANAVGLYSEELDVKTYEFLGNFPQSYTHLGLINSAFNLTLRAKRIDSSGGSKKISSA